VKVPEGGTSYWRGEEREATKNVGEGNLRRTSGNRLLRENNLAENEKVGKSGRGNQTIVTDDPRRETSTQVEGTFV